MNDSNGKFIGIQDWIQDYVGPEEWTRYQTWAAGRHAASRKKREQAKAEGQRVGMTLYGFGGGNGMTYTINETGMGDIIKVRHWDTDETFEFEWNP